MQTMIILKKKFCLEYTYLLIRFILDHNLNLINLL